MSTKVQRLSSSWCSFDDKDSGAGHLKHWRGVHPPGKNKVKLDSWKAGKLIIENTHEHSYMFIHDHTYSYWFVLIHWIRSWDRADLEARKASQHPSPFSQPSFARGWNHCTGALRRTGKISKSSAQATARTNPALSCSKQLLDSLGSKDEAWKRQGTVVPSCSNWRFGLNAVLSHPPRRASHFQGLWRLWLVETMKHHT